MKRKAYTLIEMLVVIPCIVVIATFVYAGFDELRIKLKGVVEPVSIGRYYYHRKSNDFFELEPESQQNFTPVAEALSIFRWLKICKITADKSIGKLIAIICASVQAGKKAMAERESKIGLIQVLPTPLFTCNYRIGCAYA